ncbi:MAG: ATPase [Acidobacteria bacterium]|nr:ATPase [Acidobacteriota bacterium]MCB9397488.1 ATPase [Acidobacteriota bacterium]
MTVFVGVDVGSSATKSVVLDENKQVLERFILPTSLRLELDIQQLANQLANAFPCQRIVFSTGYGRNRVPFAVLNKPEIICHTKGVFSEFPYAMDIVDIGGQDNKVIKVNDDGTIQQFKMNSKCAAGTGAFLEEIAHKANLSLDELHGLAMTSHSQAPLNSFCTVFAMTELIKRVMQGESLPDLARGVYLSVAERIREMVGHRKTPVVVTGGVIQHNPLLCDILIEKLGDNLKLPAFAQFTGALGAALYAWDSKDCSEVAEALDA